MSWRSGPNRITKRYEFDLYYAGSIIGHKGAVINNLKKINGVMNVICDTKTSPTSCFVEVEALNPSACEEVYSEIQRIISFKQVRTSMSRGPRHEVYGSWHSAQRCVAKIYEFDICHAGTIIGHKGYSINILRKIVDVTNVYCDVSSSPTSCFVQVEALYLSACEEVYSEIQRWIAKQASSSLVAQNRKIFLEAKEFENEIVLTLYDGKRNIPVVIRSNKENSFYFFERFEIATEHSNLVISNINTDPMLNLVLENFSYSSIEKTFQETLGSIDFLTNPALELKFFPGKIVFVGSGLIETKRLYRPKNGIVESYLKPVFINFLNPFFRDQLFANLKKNNFYNINEEEEEAFTIVHIYSEVNKKTFSVKLDPGKNPKEFNERKANFRITDRKREEIARVFNATTVGEVLYGTEPVNILYRKLTLLLHPDKNSDHGAAEAYKKLQHAYQTIIDGKSKSTLALKIELPITNLASKLSKLATFTTGNTKLCTVTTFSKDVLDLRASIVSYENESEELSPHLENVLYECWEERDLQGGIRIPKTNTGIYIDCIKQIIAKHIWLKEITMSNGSFLLEVTVNEIREDLYNQNDWQECIEVNLKIVIEERDWKYITATDLTEEFLKIKEEWKNICPKL